MSHFIVKPSIYFQFIIKIIKIVDFVVFISGYDYVE